MLEEKKDEFISIASHELKTPLTTIKAYMHVVSKLCKECPEEVVKYINKMSQLVDKLSFLLNDLLDISKIHLGKLDLSRSEVNMDTFLPEILNSIQHITNDHKIILDQNAVTKVSVDAIRLEQVITNLVSNATKYSPGRDKIIISSVVENNEIIFSFTDYGIGIPNENIDKIFNRFYRVDESAAQFSGLGIGLFISSQIIKQHGGKIWVESIVGKGSTFYFNLPLLN
jgi:two-component system CheB/CheR fusion protein